MANLKAVTRKLQKAILSTGLIIKIETSQFYSKEQERLITLTIISTPTLHLTKRKNGKIVIMKYYELHPSMMWSCA